MFDLTALPRPTRYLPKIYLDKLFKHRASSSSSTFTPTVLDRPLERIGHDTLLAVLRGDQTLSIHPGELLRDLERGIQECEAQPTHAHGALEAHSVESDRLTRYIGSIELQKTHFQRQYTTLNALSAPIRQLPADLLRKIFAEVGASPNVIKWSEGYCAIIIPAVALTHVCSRWRSIASASGELYTSVKTHGDGTALGSRGLQALAYLLHQSGTKPLHIEHIVDLDVSHEECAFDEIALVARHSDRIHTLRMRVTEVITKQSDFPFSLDNSPAFPALRYLEISSAALTRRLLFSPCHELRSVSLISTKPEGLELPWSQLTSLSLSQIDVSSLASALTACISMRCLQLDRVHFADYTMEGRTKSPVICSSVDILRLSSDASSMFHMLRLLQLPSLSEAHLANPTLVKAEDAGHGDAVCAMDAFSELITRSGCSLHTLSLTDILVEPATLIGVLGKLGSLSSLTFVETPSEYSAQSTLADELINSLHCQDPSLFYSYETPAKVLLPSLKMLSITTQGHIFLNKRTATMVESRKAVDTGSNGTNEEDKIPGLCSFTLKTWGKRKTQPNPRCWTELRAQAHRKMKIVIEHLKDVEYANVKLEQD